jgi:hypothetical protein
MDHTPAKMTPREYAKYRSQATGTIVQAQLIYYYVRQHKIELDTCECGRRVIDVKLTDEFFRLKEERR